MDLIKGPLAGRCEFAARTVPEGVWASLEAEIGSAAPDELNAYLAGAMHDGTISRLHNTVHIAQSDLNWMQMLGRIFGRLGESCWFYREGRRDIYVVESSWRSAGGPFITPASMAGYVRGYFDAEGGLPRDPKSRFYLQFCQKDRADLEEVRGMALTLGVRCGRLHVPSVRVDPDYWRFYIRADSFDLFTDRITSWHPRKRTLLEGQRSKRLALRPDACAGSVSRPGWQGPATGYGAGIGRSV